MPTYEYECESCLNRFEIVQKMSDAPLSECPQCGKRIRRVLSAGIGIMFHGSGFYANDSKKPKTDAAQPAAVADKPDSKDAEAPKPAEPKVPACPAACPSCPAAAENVKT